MYYRNYLDGIIPVGEFLFFTVVRDVQRNGHAPDDKTSGYEYLANEECIKKMLQPVACNGHSLLNNVDAIRALVEMSWYFEPTEMEESTYWSDAAIRKMREPTGHGYPMFMPETSLDKLVSMI